MVERKGAYVDSERGGAGDEGAPEDDPQMDRGWVDSLCEDRRDDSCDEPSKSKRKRGKSADSDVEDAPESPFYDGEGYRLNVKGERLRDHRGNFRTFLSRRNITARWNSMTHCLEVQGVAVVADGTINSTLIELENMAADERLSRSVALKRMLSDAAAYHPVIEWLDQAAWDGVDRRLDFLNSLQFAADQDRRLAALLVWRWAIGACKALVTRTSQQGVLVLCGPQGRQKGRWVESLVPPEMVHCVQPGFHLEVASRDLVQQATSVWITEIAELDGALNRQEIAMLKGFFTRPLDTYRSAYALREVSYPRCTAFIATVNEQQYLRDPTGNRRFWTLKIERCNPEHGLDVGQYWRQALVAARAGAKHWLDEGETEALAQANEAHEHESMIAQKVMEQWEPSGGIEWRKAHEVWSSVMGDNAKPTPTEEKELLSALRKMGASRSDTKMRGTYSWAVSRRQGVSVRTAASSFYGEA